MIKNNGCCSFELAKRLKNLKVKRDSLWHWFIDEQGEKRHVLFACYLRESREAFYSAFTVAELFQIIRDDGHNLNSIDIDCDINELADNLANIVIGFCE